ncbi:MAG: helix-turn-helix domain-containing protein [bacterium]
MEDLNKHIAATLKELRQKKGLSLDKVALATGVSKAMLGQIERGESSPTVATLWKIAVGFDAPFSLFIAENNNLAHGLAQGGEHVQSVHLNELRMQVVPLFPFDEQLKFELFVIELSPHYEHLSLPHQQGVVEHVVVVAGSMEVLIAGIWHRLSSGEGISFAADQPHGYRNPSAITARFHNIIHYC